MRKFIYSLIAFILTATPVLAAPQVVVTIKPLQSLVASVMDGVAEPYLLIDGNMSPHTYHLKPSDAKKINEADLVFWMGSDMEKFMDKPLATLSVPTKQVALLEDKKLKLLPMRKGGVWDIDDDGDQDAKHDPHIWLDPQNAIQIVKIITDKLSDVDPANAKTYVANETKTINNLKALDDEAAKKLKPLQGKPFIVFHDAYQYMEKRYDLTAAGSVIIEPDAGLSAKRITEIREKIKQSGATCIFKEPQFDDRILKPITERLTVKIGTLDPEGAADVKKGVDAYATIIRNITTSLNQCLLDKIAGKQ